MDKSKGVKSSFVVYMSILLVFAANVLPIFVGPLDNALMAAAAGLLMVIGPYIGYDFSAIADQTRQKPAGVFVPADKAKYLRMIIALFIITVESFVVGVIVKSIPENTIAMDIFATLATMGVYVSGMKNVKKATLVDGGEA